MQTDLAAGGRKGPEERRDGADDDTPTARPTRVSPRRAGRGRGRGGRGVEPHWARRRGATTPGPRRGGGSPRPRPLPPHPPPRPCCPPARPDAVPSRSRSRPRTLRRRRRRSRALAPADQPGRADRGGPGGAGRGRAGRPASHRRAGGAAGSGSRHRRLALGLTLGLGPALGLDLGFDLGRDAACLASRRRFGSFPAPRPAAPPPRPPPRAGVRGRETPPWPLAVWAPARRASEPRAPPAYAPGLALASREPCLALGPRGRLGAGARPVTLDALGSDWD